MLFRTLRLDDGTKGCSHTRARVVWALHWRPWWVFVERIFRAHIFYRFLVAWACGVLQTVGALQTGREVRPAKGQAPVLTTYPVFGSLWEVRLLAAAEKDQKKKT